jgi:hypothetical protein
MTAPRQIVYQPPPTLQKFIQFHRVDELFQCWVTGPVGSGKTTADFFKLVYLASLEQPDPDGVRRTKCVIVRNTMPQLKDTTIASWRYWFQDGVAGDWKETDKTFTLRFPGVECVVMFRALDTPDDVQRVLSLEMNFCIVDEFVQIPYQIIEALTGRLGRYRRPDGTKPSIYGMWGASNPDTEDNWWFDYLHRTCPDPNRNMPDDTVARYYSQPSGLTPEAENLDNLPNNYYKNLIRGKSPAWVKQFVEGEWGFSAAGTPVFSAFSKKRHVVKGLQFNRHLPLIVGFDPGLGGSAFVYMQLDLQGRLNVLGESVQRGLGAQRLMDEVLKPYLKARFPEAKKIIIAADPAAGNKSQNDERTIVQTLKKDFTVWKESNNRLPLRLNAIDYFATRIVGVDESALRIDEDNCPHLIRGCGGGWRWESHAKKDMLKRDEPEDTPYTHVCDAFAYGARFFHKKEDLNVDTTSLYGRKPQIQAFRPVNYHLR